MLKKVSYSRNGAETRTISIRNPNPNEYVIRSIEGIDAGGVDLFLSERATMDGSTFGGFRKPSREIVFEFGYGPASPPEQQRNMSYVDFPLGHEVKMTFETEARVLEIDGIVESNNATIFTDTPGFQVVFICSDVYFKTPDIGMTSLEYKVYEKLFEFPFSNESLEDPLLEVGNYTPVNSVDIFYSGSIDTGIEMEISTLNPQSTIDITNGLTGESLKLNTSSISSITGKPFSGDDVLRINTIRGYRSIKLIRDSIEYNVLNIKDKSSNWLSIARGTNPLIVVAELTDNALDISIKIRELHIGV